MARNVYVSGRANIYEAIKIFSKLRDKFPKGSKEREEIEDGLRQLYRGQYLNEEQLKAMYQLGYIDSPVKGWLDDDFDD